MLRIAVTHSIDIGFALEVDIPRMQAPELDAARLYATIFADYANIVEEWLVGHPRSAK